MTMHRLVGVLLLCAATAVCGMERADDREHAAAVGAVHAARSLIERILPQHADRFELEWIPAEDGRDVFEIESRAERIVIRGNNGVSLATGWNWYLNHYCNCHVSLHGRQLQLPEPLPSVAPRLRRVSWARHRYFLNYCSFGYSLPWWDWGQWQELIDWMALHGVNMPLAVTGQEAVWQSVGRQLGMNDDELAAFLAGPPYLPFQWMGCLDGWGGPLPPHWIDRHVQLQQQILTRQRELGMTPVLQGFTGHVPAALLQKFPDAKAHRIEWIEWQTHLLDPLDPLFARTAALFLAEQQRLYGTDHLYAADTFIEMAPPRGEVEYLDRLSRAIYAGMANADPQAVWVLQGWAFMFHRDFWTQPRIGAFLDAVPDDRLVVLDLFCESRPMWNQTEAFCGKPWVWCNIQSFGNLVQLGGALNRIATDLPAARRDGQAGQLVGLGFVNEGLDYNPVVQDLMFQMAWRDDAPDLNAWIVDFAAQRYGRSDESAARAWRQLLMSVYQGPATDPSVISRVPTLESVPGAVVGDPALLVRAWQDLLGAADELRESDTYRFDLVHVARQVLANQAAAQHEEIVRAWKAGDLSALRQRSQPFLQTMNDLDELLATRREFLLGCWLEDAKRWGTTDAERARYEWNARRVLTLWGQGPAINDYARKQWSGMVSDYYRPRWEQLLVRAATSLEQGTTWDQQAFQTELQDWTRQWSDRREVYPTEPRGDSLDVARALWQKYQAFSGPARGFSWPPALRQ